MLSCIPRRSALVALSVLACAVLAPRPGFAAWPHAPNVNVAVSTQNGNQLAYGACTDGAGGTIVVWQDFRSGIAKMYVQHVGADGTLQWAPAGVPVTTGAGAVVDQQSAQIVADGYGGAIVSWYDNRFSAQDADVFVQRVAANGLLRWSVDGVRLTPVTGTINNISPRIVASGTGGAIVGWHGDKSNAGTNFDIFAQRVDSSGVTLWAGGPVDLSNLAGNQRFPSLAADGLDGAIVAWDDETNGGNTNIYAQRIKADGTFAWGASPVPVCLATGEQQLPFVISDGLLGAEITWQDHRASSTDIYAQRLAGASGAPLWPLDGISLCSATGEQLNPQLVSDGANGAIAVWQDSRGTGFDIYAQGVSAAGVPEWTGNGVALCLAAGDQTNPIPCADGSGGAFVAWWDGRNGVANNRKLYVQRVGATGAIGLGWAPNGDSLCTAVNDQIVSALVADAAGGVVATWYDNRNGTVATPNYDVYAQRIEHYGKLGSPEPQIASVKDVPNDQGGHVRLAWNASYLDTDLPTIVDSYSIWRQVPAAAALSAVTRGSASLSWQADRGSQGGRPVILATRAAAQTLYWEFVTTVPAYALPAYSYDAATTSDSVAGANPTVSFMVSARNSLDSEHWNSAPAAGYSVDNLPPSPPALLVGNYVPSQGTALHWTRSTEADLAGYRLYRGNNAGFVPAPANLVSAQPDTGYFDTGSAAAPQYYKLSVVDVHGNESGALTLAPSNTLGALGSPAPSFALERLAPNPAEGGRFRVRFALPDDAPARLEVLDVAGRLLADRQVGSLGAGAHEVNLSDRARIAPGIYLVRLSRRGEARVVRAAVVK